MVLFYLSNCFIDDTPYLSYHSAKIHLTWFLQNLYIKLASFDYLCIRKNRGATTLIFLGVYIVTTSKSYAQLLAEKEAKLKENL